MASPKNLGFMRVGAVLQGRRISLPVPRNDVLPRQKLKHYTVLLPQSLSLHTPNGHMGDINQLTYLKRHVPSTPGPVLEVGSKDYGSTSSFRSVYTAGEYIGVDMAHGKGVDAVVDLVEGIGSLPEGHFDLVICCSVMEHVRMPWVFANNLSRLTRGGGQIYISVPWVWRYHAYPDDYFRFSYRGVMELFPRFKWNAMEYSTNVPGEFIPISGDGKRGDDSMAIHRRTGFLSKQRRKYLPYLMVNMLGTNPTEAA